MKFTKEEIELCRKIAEKERKRIDEGDWYLPGENTEPDLYIEGTSNDKIVAKSLPLWTLSDCLEWLREKGYRFCGGSEAKSGTWWFSFTNTTKSLEGGFYNQGEGRTPLEACLKAVLAVLEE